MLTLTLDDLIRRAWSEEHKANRRNLIAARISFNHFTTKKAADQTQSNDKPENKRQMYGREVFVTYFWFLEIARAVFDLQL